MKKSKTIRDKKISKTQTTDPEYGPNGLSPKETKANLAEIAKIKRKSAENWKREEAEMKKRPLPEWINDLYPIPIDADFYKALARIEAIKLWCIDWCKSNGKRLMGRSFKVDIDSLQRQVINTANSSGPGYTLTDIAKLWEGIYNKITSGDMVFLATHEKKPMGAVEAGDLSILKYEKFAERRTPWTAMEIAQRLGLKNFRTVYGWAGVGLQVEKKYGKGEGRIYLTPKPKDGKHIVFDGKEVDNFLSKIEPTKKLKKDRN